MRDSRSLVKAAKIGMIMVLKEGIENTDCGKQGSFEEAVRLL